MAKPAGHRALLKDHRVFCERMREFRLAKRLTAAQLGDAVGLTRAQISNIELGTSDVVLSTGLMIADALGKSFVDFFVKQTDTYLQY